MHQGGFKSLPSFQNSLTDASYEGFHTVALFESKVLQPLCWLLRSSAGQKEDYYAILLSSHNFPGAA